MKKVLMALLVLAMILSFTAFAETVEFDGFSIEIPENFKENESSDRSSYRTFVDNSDFWDAELKVYRYESISFDNAVQHIAEMTSLVPLEYSDYDCIVSGNVGNRIAQLSFAEMDDTRVAVIESNNDCYEVSLEKFGGLEEKDIDVWNSLIQSVIFSTSEESPISDEGQKTEDEVYDYPTLEKGSKGDEVKTLQQRLVDLYWLDGSVDGDYGNKTKDAVERFQEEAGLPVTGVADGKTQAKLFADDAPEASMSVSCSSAVIGNYGTTSWYVNGQSFTLKGNQTKKLKTPWGTYVFNALGEYEQVG